MKQLLIATAVALTLSACSVRNDGALEHWKNYGSDNLSTAELSDKQALAVFYRTENFQGPALNVYINGDYHASLLEKGYSPIPVCATNQLVSASYTTSEQFGNRTQGTSYALPVKEVAFFRATVDAKGTPSFERVEEAVARQELNALNGKVTHTLSRAFKDKDCTDIVLSNKVLSAHALWGLDKHTYKDMLPKGKQEIAEFAEFVKGNEQIGRIEVRGYTDPEASEAYNQALSERRANTVRQALVQAGVSQTISAKGYGETNLIVGDCAAHKDLKARAACNQPNRRVEITTYSK